MVVTPGRHDGVAAPARLAVVGAGAFGSQHLDALARIEEARVTWVVDSDLVRARRAASRHEGTDVSTDLAAVLDRDDVDAVVLATPTPDHATQAVAAMRAGKDVLVEIPLADSWAAAHEVAQVQRETGRTCMVGHVRRWNPSHAWIRRRIDRGELTVQHLVVQTFFMRRTNVSANGEPRSWTDHLLWHHAAHTVDLFSHQVGEPVEVAHALQGPIDPGLGIPLDMSVTLRSRSGVLCTFALSFNNAGPQGSWFRYVCDSGTYVARYDDLEDGEGNRVDLGTRLSGIELQDREFVAALISGARRPSTLPPSCPATGCSASWSRRSWAEPLTRQESAGRARGLLRQMTDPARPGRPGKSRHFAVSWASRSSLA